MTGSRAAGAGVRFLPRFVYGQEILGVMRRASLVVLPYREIDQSGVAFAGLGAGTPLLLSDAGGFPELAAATGAARVVAAGSAPALHDAIADLLADPRALAELASRSRAAGEGELSWERIARRTLDLYGRLLAP